MSLGPQMPDIHVNKMAEETYNKQTHKIHVF